MHIFSLFLSWLFVFVDCIELLHFLLQVRGQWWPGGDTPRPRSGVARRSHLVPEARGGDLEEPPRARGQGRQLGRATHAGGQGRRPGGAI